MSALGRIQLASNFLAFVRGIQNPIENYTLACNYFQGFCWFNYDVSEYMKHFLSIRVLRTDEFFLFKSFCTSTQV